jgi:hypothetical protein
MATATIPWQNRDSAQTLSSNDRAKRRNDPHLQQLTFKITPSSWGKVKLLKSKP